VQQRKWFFLVLLIAKMHGLQFLLSVELTNTFLADFDLNPSQFTPNLGQ
jgi:hypothetical protein